MYDIRGGTFIAAILLFLFMPLFVWFMPSKPEPYKKLRKESSLERQLKRVTTNCLHVDYMVRASVNFTLLDRLAVIPF